MLLEVCAGCPASVPEVVALGEFSDCVVGYAGTHITHEVRRWNDKGVGKIERYFRVVLATEGEYSWKEEG
jgi:hypothetical protein